MIFKLNEEQYGLYKKYVLGVYEGKALDDDDIKYEVIVPETEMFDFTDAADYAIIHYGMVNQDYLTELGVKLQLLYDEIHYQKKQHQNMNKK